MKTEHPLRSLCEALEVSSSGYYSWFNRQAQPCPRVLENERLAPQIAQGHQASRQTYGIPRVPKALSQAGHAYGRHRLARLMRLQGLCGRAQGRFRAVLPTAITTSPALPIACPICPLPALPTQSGSATSPMFPPTKAGSRIANWQLKIFNLQSLSQRAVLQEVDWFRVA